MPFKGWIIKQIVVYPHHGILHSNQKEKFIHGAISMDLREENDAECKKKKKNKPDLRRLQDPIYMAV